MYRYTGLQFSAVFVILVATLPCLCFSNIGAEWNPTGNPIGGGPGYSDSVRHQDADFYVCNKQSLLTALSAANAGDIVYVADTAVIDLTGEEDIYIPGGVTLASGRGRILDDTISWGGVLRTDDTEDPEIVLFRTTGTNVRITGLRIIGPYDYRTGRNNNAMGIDNWCRFISTWYDFFEADNCEFVGWSHCALHASSANNTSFYAHHNYFRDGQYYPQGLGVYVSYGTGTLIEANLFDFCRENIASRGHPDVDWEARYNIFLEHGAEHGFDRHGHPDNYGWGGGVTSIHHNTVKNVHRNAVRIRGKPADSAVIYNNWFYHQDSASAIMLFNGDTNAHIYDNHFTATPMPEVQSRIPVSTANSSTDSGEIPLTVSFSSDGSYDPDGDILWYEWDFGDNANTVRRDASIYTFDEIGRYLVELTVHDDDGIVASDNVQITAYPSDDSCYISAWTVDLYHDADTGYFFKQILIDGDVVWEDDLAGDEGWVHVVENVTGELAGKDSVTVTLRLCCKKNVLNQEVPHPEIWWDDVVLFYGTLANGDFEANNNWVYSENEQWFWGGYSSADVRSGNQSYHIYCYTHLDNIYAGEYGQIQQRVSVGEMGILYGNNDVRICTLACPFPNPARQSSNISYQLSSPARISIRIYDVVGRLVGTLVERDQIQGEYSVIWDGTDMSGNSVTNGIYFCSLVAGDFEETKQIVWLR
jgi:PKD repeat protein